MSLNFWIELLLIIVVFGAIVWSIPRYRQYQKDKAHAHGLRVEVSDNIKMTLPHMAATSIQTLDEFGLPKNDSTSLKFCLFQLDNLIKDAATLYSDEQQRVARYRSGLHALIANYDKRTLSNEMTEDLILLGERIVEDLRENGLLSTVSR